MPKLYSDEPTVTITAPPPIHLLKTHFEEDLVSLENHTAAYCSVGNIADSVACESFQFVTPGNSALYNEYVTLLSKVYRIDAPKRVDSIAFESASVQTVNASIALEGWMADIWTKIKNAFKGISETIKKFSAGYFSTMGRVKKGLENLKTVLDKTEKDLPTGDHDLEVPSALQTLLTGHKDVSPTSLKASIATSSEFVAAFDKIGKASISVVDTGFLSAEFIAGIKRMKERALSASESIKQNESNRDGPLGKFGKNNRDITAANKKLTDIQRESEVEAAQGDSLVDAVGDMDQGEDVNHAEALKAFKAFADGVVAEVSSLKDKPLAGGKLIKSVTVAEDKLTIESGDAEGQPDTFVPGARSELLSLVKLAQDALKAGEDTIKTFSAINDKADKAIETVDKLVSEVDKGDPERYGKFKNVITQSVRTRLKLLQGFFTNYNKIGKNALEVSMNVGKATIAYCTVSMSVYK